MAEAINVAKIQELKARNPKGCGFQEVAPGNWVKMDCHNYQSSTKAVLHLSTRKAKALQARTTFWKPVSMVKSRFGSLANLRLNVGGAKGGGERAVTPGSVAGAGDVKAETFPSTVDHRAENLEGPIKDQGPVGSCTAFSLSTTIDNAAIRAGKLQPGNATNAASPNHVWSGYGIPQMGTAADANLGRTIGTLGVWPQSHREACELGNATYEDCGSYVTPSAVPGTWRNDSKLMAKYDQANSSAVYKINNFEKLQTLPPNMDEIISTLASGSDLWIAMKIDGYAWSNSKMKNGVIPDWSDPSGGHAITMSGYRVTPSGRQFLIHNSWGTSWGDQGYAWVSENMVQKYMHYAYKVKIDGGVKKEDITDDDCAPDELVDIQSLVCALICPDDSRPNGGCGTAGGAKR
ncbi:hypothetical protein AKJ09_03130 [Labilithrix luteola]|uniref:Peptidase C1A papain C-terminal domain-containing protein n=1 Tax=Labilithrix luteola TaxID=1391654 RepID=A0A0K1PSW6_9BACT|nr:hypothetical protein AKJ09_03130 [Labilithrix luteola]